MPALFSPKLHHGYRSGRRFQALMYISYISKPQVVEYLMGIGENSYAEKVSEINGYHVVQPNVVLPDMIKITQLMASIPKPLLNQVEANVISYLIEE